MSQPTAIIIGAGISGLARGWALQNEGWAVRVLESASIPGGPVFSRRESGYLAEAGPNSLLLNSPDLEELLKRLGLESDMVEAAPDARKRYLVRNGQALAVPMGPGEAWRTPLFSTSAKLRLLTEPFRRKPHNLVEESVAAFVRRRLGPEILDYAVNPLIGGIYAGDPERLSLQHAFPKLAALEAEHGSLLLGAIARRRAQKRAGAMPYKTRTVSFRQGMGSLPQALARQLGDRVSCGVTLVAIKQNGDGWTVVWDAGGKRQEASADRLVLAVPAWKLASLPLPQDLSEKLSPLAEIPHPPVSVLFLGFPRAKVRHPLDGFGMLVPAKEKRSILGALFSSSLFPERAPEGHVALTVFLGGSRHPDLAQLSAENQLHLAMKDLSRYLGVSGNPHFVRHVHWPKAIPQYVMGWARFQEIMQHAEKGCKGLELTGNYRHGISVGQCLLAAQGCSATSGSVSSK